MPLMKNSRLPDDWVARAVAGNPFQKMQNSNWCTCPVRLAFVHIVKPNPNAKNDDGTPKTTPSYEVTALCPPGATEQIDGSVWPELYAMMRASFPQNIGGNGQPFGLHNPLIRDQGEKQQYAGYTPGLRFLRFTSQFKPAIVDPALNPIVDEARVYPGVWAILHFNMYEFGKSPPRPKKGFSLGLQSVMIIADDEKLAGGAPDAREAFAGIKVDSRFDAASAFAQAAPAAPPPPASAIMPPPMTVGGAPPPPPAPAFAPPPPPAAPAPVVDLAALLG